MTGSRRRFLRQLAAGSILAAGPGRRLLRADPESSSDVAFLTPADAGFEERRQPFNRRITLQPAVIAVCGNEAGVQAAVEYARKRSLPIAVKSGGHSLEGYCLNRDGLVIDLSRMSPLTIDAAHRLTVGAGVRLAGLFDFLLPRGRIIPTGSCGGVGVAGLALGGGYGMFSGKYGLTCDHLTGVRMVDGRGRIHDSADEPELLWACRGGGNGSFGVVTSLRFETRPAPERLHSYRFRYLRLDPAKATELLRRWFTVGAALPPEAFSAFILDGTSLTVLVTTFLTTPGKDFLRGPIAGLAAGADAALPVVSAATAVSVKRYYGRSTPQYFKNVSSGFFRGFDDIQAVAPEVFRRVAARPGLLFQMNTFGGNAGGGAAARASAFPHRQFRFVGELQSYWESPSREKPFTEAIRGLQRLLRENGVRAHYANYPDADLEDWAEAYYGRESYRRLQIVKRTYDPDDRIRHPQSVRLPGA